MLTMARNKAGWWSNAIQNKLIIMVLAMMIVVPFIATPLDARNTGLAALTVESFGVMLLVTLLWRKKPSFKSEDVAGFLKTGANLPVLLYMMWVLVSLTQSPHFWYSVQEVMRIASGVIVYFVVAYQFRRSEHITKCVELLVYLGIGVSLFAFAQYASSPSSSHYATGLFGDHQLLGSFLMIILPFVCVAALTEQSPNKQLIAQISAVSTVIALLMSQARSAWVGSASGITVLAIMLLWNASYRNSMVRKKHEVVMPIMLIAVAVGFFFLVSPESGNIGDRMHSTLNGSSESAVAYRAQLADGALAMIKERPITGQGVGLYSMYQYKYTKSGMAISRMHERGVNKIMKAKPFARPGMGEMAHNLYLQTGAELGLPGLLLIIAIPISFVTLGLNKVRIMDEGIRRSVLLASIASTTAFVVDAIASPSWQFGQLSMFFWLTLGLGASSLRPRHRFYSSTREIAELEEEHSTSPARAAMRVLSAAVGIGLLAVIAPSVIYASPPGYAVPKSADIEPKNALIFSFQQQAYTLTVTFTDNSQYDVTTEPTTIFSIIGAHQGFLNGVNNSVYNAGIGPETVTIKGQYTQNSVTVSDSTQLFVVRGG
jgi:O-antigen ligase